MDLRRDALTILKETSRTFYIPIIRLPSGLQEAVASAYLCMRAIDEIEDHPGLDNSTKAKLLRTISLTLQAAVDGFAIDDFSKALSNHTSLIPQIAKASVDGSLAVDDFSVALSTPASQLPEVSIRLGEWAVLAPKTIAPRIWDATAAMADRMAHWAESDWKVHTEADLDRYTFAVAGTVGLLLSDLWAWYDGTQTNRAYALGFGRGLQSLNILRNRAEDLERGVNFFPDGWSEDDMQRYSRRNLAHADAYLQDLPVGSPASDFCQIILTLGYATLDTLARGEHKLSRSDVLALIKQVTEAKK